MTSRWTIYVAVGAALLAVGCKPASPSPSEQAAPHKAKVVAQENALPPRVVEALSRVDRAELISLEPWAAPKAPGDRLEGNLILGAAKLSQRDARAAGGIISSAVGAFDGMIAACFDPRHALRFQSARHTYLIVVCFNCGSLRVFEDGRKIGDAALTGSPAGLNTMLVAARVPISHSAEQEAAKSAREDETNHRRWEAGMPRSVRPVWTDQVMNLGDLRDVRAALIKEFPNPQDRIRALLERQRSWSLVRLPLLRGLGGATPL